MQDRDHEDAAATAAANELIRALSCAEPLPSVERLVARYDAAFDRWVITSGFDPARSSFEQRAEADAAPTDAG